jgi:NAD(P)H-flavin reductase
MSAPGTMVPRSGVVRKLARDTDDTFTLTIDMGEPFPFLPGQFNMLYHFGVGEVPISISGDPAKPQTLVHTIRAVGAVTDRMETLRKGDVVGVRGPFGVPWPVDLAGDGRDLVLLAGGIGLAPLRPVIYHALARRSKTGRLCVAYGARTPSDLLYVNELQKWGGRFDTSLMVTVDRGDDDWRGRVGVVTTLLPKLDFDATRAIAMVCGPEVMMRFSVRALHERGVAHDRIFISMERNMHCGVGFCGHCQWGPHFVCKDGPVFRFDKIAHLFSVREL